MGWRKANFLIREEPSSVVGMVGTHPGSFQVGKIKGVALTGFSSRDGTVWLGVNRC